MAQLIDVTRVEVGPRTLTATVRLADDAPLMTSEDLEGTTRVYRLMPGIIDHLCLGDAGDTFRDVMGNTELAHLLEHATVELLAQSEMAGDISSGRTRAIGDDGRSFEIELACPDDVLVCGALSSACWMLDWAYTGGEGPEPDVEATVGGLVSLVQSLPEPTPTGPAADAASAAATMQPTGPMLQLVDDAPPAVVDARGPRTDDREPRVSPLSGSAPSVEQTAAPTADRSPEALQASADGTGGSVRAAGARGTSSGGMRGASPSVTADLPASTSLR